MEYTKPTLMLVGEVGAVVLGFKDGDSEDSHTSSPPGALLGLDD